MNDEFRNDKDEVVDSIPENAQSINNNEPTLHNENNYRGYHKQTRIVIEREPLSTMVKIGFMLSLGSLVLCCFPVWSFVFAFLGAGISLLAIGFKQSGKGPAILAIAISVVGCILAAINGLWLMAWNIIVNLLS